MGRAPSTVRALAVAAVLSVGPTTARATVPDMIGIGARWQGAGGGGVAVVEDGTAALVNPAGLSRVRRPTAAIGALGGWPQFEDVPPLWWDTNRDGVVDERDEPLPYDATPPAIGGVQAQASRNVGGKFGIGFTAYVPSNTLIRFHMFEPELPTYVMWNNRTQRFVAAAGLGGEILPGVNVGAGVNVLAKAKILVATTIDAGVSGEGTAGDTTLDGLISDVVIDVHEIDLKVVPGYSPIVGVQLDAGQWVDALDGLVLGAAYRGEVGLPLDVRLDLQANVAASDIGELDPFVTAVVAEAQLALFDHYVPQRVDLGIAYRRSNALTAYADLRWTDWRRMRLNVANVASADLTSPLVDIDDRIVDGNPVNFDMKAVWSVRAGADLALPEIEVDGRLRYVRLSFRGGFGLEPSPLVAQSADSALLDTDRVMYTLGAGVEVWDPFALVDGAVWLDLFFQLHTLARADLPRSSDFPRAGYPVGAATIPSGGTLPVVGAQWSFQY